MIKKGTLLLVTKGEYSDYTVSTVCFVQKDFEPVAVRDEFRIWWKDQPLPEGRTALYAGDEMNAFLPWLLRSDYLLEAAHEEWHLGDYDLDSMEV